MGVINPLDIVPYNKSDLQTLLENRGLAGFKAELNGWYRTIAMAVHPDKVQDPVTKKIREGWQKVYNYVDDALSDADEPKIQEWINNQHSSGGADDALLAGALTQIKSLEARLANAITALNNGRRVSAAELLEIVDPNYTKRVEILRRDNAGLQARVEIAERNARTYQQQLQSYEQRATTAERAVSDGRGEATRYLQEAAALKQRAESMESLLRELRDRAKTLEERLSAETSRAQSAESKLGTANQNLEYAQRYGEDVFGQLQTLQGQFAALQEDHTRIVAASLDVFAGMVKRYESMPADQIYDEARTLRLAGKFWEAIVGFRYILGVDPNNLHANAELGVTYKGLWEREKDPLYRDRAVRYSQMALEIEPRHQFSRDIVVGLIEQAYQEAHQLRLNGKYNQAIAEFKRILAWDNNHLHANADLGATYARLWEKSGDSTFRNQAAFYSQRVLDIEPRHQFSRDILSRLG